MQIPLQTWWYPSKERQRGATLVVPGNNRHSTKLPTEEEGGTHAEGHCY